MGVSDKDVFGTDPRLLYRADAPETSIEAAYSVDTTKLEHMVFEEIYARGEKGCIADDLINLFSHLPYSSITARPCSLERKGLIVRGPDKRLGNSGRNQFVMRVVAILRKADD